jgi:hypothetical protein
MKNKIKEKVLSWMSGWGGEVYILLLGFIAYKGIEFIINTVSGGNLLISGVFSLVYFKKIGFTILTMSAFLAIVKIFMNLTWGSVGEYLKKDFTSDFKYLSPQWKVIISVVIFLSFLLSLVFLYS